MGEQPEPDDQGPAGEFPPGLDELSGQIERLASQPLDPADLRAEIADLSGQFAAMQETARRAVDRVDGNLDALGDYVLRVLDALKQEAIATLSANSSLAAGGAVHGAGAILMAKMSISASGTVTAGPASLAVQAHPGSVEVTPDPAARPAARALLDRLSAGYIVYIILIWLLVAGVGVVIREFKLPPDVAEQIQTDPNYVAIAMDLTVLLLALGKRK